jgi:hypothetical protein
LERHYLTYDKEWHRIFLPVCCIIV